jgi:transcriptional regulator with XRE-family HTH domain
MNKPIHYFTKELKQFRDDRDWTQQQLADYLTLQLGEKIGRVTVALWESQDRAVNADKALAIASALKIQVMDLVERKGGE